MTIDHGGAQLMQRRTSVTGTLMLAMDLALASVLT